MFLPIMPNFVLDSAAAQVEQQSAIKHALRDGRPITEGLLQKPYDKYLFDEFGKPKYTLPSPDSNPSPAPYKPSAKGLTPAKLEEIDYINADLAKYYGMSKSTAYQEALLNTAYQREVQDMKAAGLNPAVMYSGGRASGADTSLYPSEKSSGGGGYSRRRSSHSSKASNGKLFSTSAYAAIQAIGGLIGLATTKNAGGFWIGSQTAKGAMGALDAVHSFFK